MEVRGAYLASSCACWIPDLLATGDTAAAYRVLYGVGCVYFLGCGDGGAAGGGGGSGSVCDRSSRIATAVSHVAEHAGGVRRARSDPGSRGRDPPR